MAEEESYSSTELLLPYDVERNLETSVRRFRRNHQLFTPWRGDGRKMQVVGCCLPWSHFIWLLCVHVCVHTHLEVRDRPSASSLTEFHLMFWSSWSWSSSTRLGWLGELPRAPLSTPKHWSYRDSPPCLTFGCWGSELSSSCLYSMYFTDRSISQLPLMSPWTNVRDYRAEAAV